MNPQTLKPRARVTHKFGRSLWRVTFPGSHIGYVSSTLAGALAVAHRCRLARLIGRRDA
jgi:hypothetical protein